MRYFLIWSLLFSLNSSYAQNYKAVIAAHREHYKQDFLKEARSPLTQSNLKDLHFFEADSNFVINARVEHLINEQSFLMPTYSGTSKEYIRYAVLHFTYNEQPLELTVYKSIALSKKLEYRDHLFLPFTDLSNSKESYAGGRYLDLNIADIKDNHVQIDFNKAYNPYCAYSDGYQCPKPPEENNLKIAVNAGEKQYTGDKKH